MNVKTTLLALSFAAAGATGYALVSQLHQHDDNGKHQTNHHDSHAETSHQENEHQDHGHEGHHHGDASEQADKGEHGGKLLSEGDFAIELTIFETGIPPEMRLYGYEKGRAIDLDQLKVTVTLDRLGGQQDVLTFTPEKDYLLGSQMIAEPHSYNVTVSAEYEGKFYQWEYESHEGRAFISDRLFIESGMQTETVGSQLIKRQTELYGLIVTPQGQTTRAFAPYPSRIKQLHVKIGDSVKPGQTLATLQNIQTLQTYSIKSSSAGQVNQIMAAPGEIIRDTALLQMSNLDKVWVDLSAFPKDIAELAVGQPVFVESLDNRHQSSTTLSYLSPTMTDGHIARARAVIDNPNGYWKPGMHVKAQVTLDERDVALAIHQSALQSFRGMPVVFAKYGNDYEVRMLELGIADDNYIEVLGGIKPGTEYATQNSFLVKADALKDGASHDH